MSLTQLLVHYNVRFESNENLEICVDDFIENIAGCKPSYVTKIKDKTKRNGLWYKDAEVAISELCPKLRSKKAKEFYQQWKSLRNTESIDRRVPESNNEIEDTETLTSFLDIRNNYFQYKGKKVFVIIKDGIVWFKGIDIARLLDIEATAQAIQQINSENKIIFWSLSVSFKLTPENQKIDPQTIFINQEGMYDLVMSSRKPGAKIFRRWISHEVLPSMNRFGSYSIEKKYGCLYDDHDLYEYDGCNVCYMAYGLYWRT